MPEHSRQNSVPKDTDAHCGCFMGQSAHLSFPGRALTIARSAFFICDMMVCSNSLDGIERYSVRVQVGVVCRGCTECRFQMIFSLFLLLVSGTFELVVFGFLLWVQSS